MEQKLYDLMDWPGIEEIIYSESSNPDQLLGPHLTADGLLIQAFVPTADKIQVKIEKTGKNHEMEKVDEAGYFAVLIKRKSMAAYTFLITHDNGVEEETADPYAFMSIWKESDLERFESGTAYDIYQKMGAHPMVLNGQPGVSFSVWAPEAMRVSVVGDFNLWDGRRHQMKLVGNSGIYELFVPGISSGTIYKYEIKTRKKQPMLKSDPYGFCAEVRPNTASIVCDLSHFQWTDESWMEARKQQDTKTSAMSIYEVHLGSWIRKEITLDENGEEQVGSEFYDYRELAHQLAEYVLDMGYTHIELMPVMEHPLDASWGYQVTGYYAPTSRYGSPEDFMYFMNYMHQKGIGVILDWVPAHFPKDLTGLACFDGTCVYEHADPRQGMHPHWGTLIYNYGRPQVANFLIANALFWAAVYHADGIRMDAVASMLYLDYGKNDGEWVANQYGGHENLEAIEFLKHLNSVFKKRKDGAILIAEESTAWPQITGSPKDGGLGFDYKWNMGWMNDFLGYMKYDPIYRSYHYGELTFSMQYAYSENFLLVLSHDEVVHGKGSMAGKMPGAELPDKLANLRAAYGFMMAHPGKKLLFMGQDFAQIKEWNENESLQWGLLDDPVHSQMKAYVKELNHLYRKYPALYELDHDPKGFEWVNNSSKEENIIAFLRKSRDGKEVLLMVCNFSPIGYEKFDVGVPGAGKYKEIFCSENPLYGGTGIGNPRVKTAKKETADGRQHAITIAVKPFGVHLFSCSISEAKQKKTTVRKQKK